MRNRYGFTLIELLAVITVMGILLLVAVPVISRTIENSRKDIFIDTAKKYTDSAKTLWSADNILCDTQVASALDVGAYYMLVDTETRTSALLESGGKSPWGSRHVKGYVKVVITNEMFTYGDVVGTSDINESDVTNISNYISGRMEFTSIQKKAADVNKDGKIDDTDIDLINDYRNRLNIGKTLVGTTFQDHDIKFYPVLSDGERGINISTETNADGEGVPAVSANLVESSELVKGNILMSGAKYDVVAIPADATVCVRR